MSWRPRVVLTRLAAVPAVAALALTGLSAQAPPASATALNGIVQAGVGFDPGSGCTQAPADPPSQTGPLQSDGAGSDLTVNGATVATKTGDPTDTTNLAATVHAVAGATEAGNQLRNLDVAMSGSITNAAAKGALTACDSDASAALTAQSYVTVNQESILDLRSSQRAGSGGTVVVQIVNIGGLVPNQTIEVGAGTDGTARRMVELAPGTYTMIVQLAVERSTLDAVSTPSLSYAISLHAELRAPGEASSGAVGAGTKYVALPGSLDCASHSAAVGYTNKAKPGGKSKKGAKSKPTLKSATFFVDGVKVKTAKKPDASTTTLLGGIAAEDRVTIEAVVKVRGKGTVDLRRTYLPCS